MSSCKNHEYERRKSRRAFACTTDSIYRLCAILVLVLVLVLVLEPLLPLLLLLLVLLLLPTSSTSSSSSSSSSVPLTSSSSTTFPPSSSPSSSSWQQYHTHRRRPGCRMFLDLFTFLFRLRSACATAAMASALSRGFPPADANGGPGVQLRFVAGTDEIEMLREFMNVRDPGAEGKGRGNATA